jgi:hypothetical protein
MRIFKNGNDTYAIEASEKEIIAMRISAEHYLEKAINLDPDNHRAHLELKGLCARIKQATEEVMR